MLRIYQSMLNVPSQTQGTKTCFTTQREHTLLVRRPQDDQAKSLHAAPPPKNIFIFAGSLLLDTKSFVFSQYNTNTKKSHCTKNK
mmetsp:Transcript_27796/g.77882  ORF Transcript_27796/g.77882 Transcript_27796/m.77882 type:complete len:85 (+) Transcript_27796:1-255(+)